MKSAGLSENGLHQHKQDSLSSPRMLGLHQKIVRLEKQIEDQQQKAKEFETQ
jgi:hypothetical protein